MRGKLTIPSRETSVVKLFHQQQYRNCFNGVLNIFMLEKIISMLTKHKEWDQASPLRESMFTECSIS